MAAAKKGYLERSLSGKERTDDNVLPHAPKGRFSLCWDVLKGRFGRLVLINLLLVLCFAPLIAVIVLRTLNVGTQIIAGPYAGAFGVGAGALHDVTGYAENILFYTDLFYFALVVPALFIAGIGISGGGYLIRNMLRTQGIYDFKDFGRGIKRNILPVTEATVLFSVVLFVARLMGNYAELQVAVGSPVAGWLIASEVIGYIFVGIAALISLWMVALGMSYRLGPWALFKNAAAATFLLPHFSILFAALALWPLFIIIFVSGIFFTIVLVAVVFIGFVYSLLVWLDYTQWVFDTRVSPAIVIAAEEEEETPDKKAEDKPLDPEAERRILVAYGKSDLAARPMQAVDADKTAISPLTGSFTRADLRRIAESKQALRAETAAYENAHKGEEKYTAYNKQFEDRDRALQGKGKGKKLTPPKPSRRK